MQTKRRGAPCQLCGRTTELTFHHLIPRKVHRRKRFRKQVPRETLQTGIAICRLCHSGLHRLYDEMTLATRLNSLETLRTDPAIRRHVAWVRKQRVRTTSD
jgi:5-methylcytosine-specific restriction endonuclease McrA